MAFKTMGAVRYGLRILKNILIWDADNRGIWVQFIDSDKYVILIKLWGIKKHFMGHIRTVS